MNKKQKISRKTIEQCIENHLSYDEEIMLADGFEDAFVGIGRKFGGPAFAVYNRQKCLDLLIAQDMTSEEAEEFFEFNIAGAYVGENTPAFLDICQ
jgi:hypothetical protein